MPANSGSAIVDLTPEDLGALPAKLKKKIIKARAEGSKGEPRYALIRTDSQRHARFLKRTLEELPRLARLRAQKVSEENIEEMLSLLLQDADRADVDADIEADNAELRAHYLKSVPTLPSAGVHKLAGARSRNASETASRWKREGRVFAVRVKGVDYYPAFQFAEGEPRPVVKAILAALPDHLSAWQTALWFASGNGWLGGASPQAALEQERAVVDAARRLGEPAVG